MKVWITRDQMASTLVEVWNERPEYDPTFRSFVERTKNGTSTSVCTKWAKKVGLVVPKMGEVVEVELSVRCRELSRMKGSELN